PPGCLAGIRDRDAAALRRGASLLAIASPRPLFFGQPRRAGGLAGATWFRPPARRGWLGERPGSRPRSRTGQTCGGLPFVGSASRQLAATMIRRHDHAPRTEDPAPGLHAQVRAPGGDDRAARA